MKVWLVDDESEITDLTREFLGEEFQTQSFQNPVEALKQLKSLPNQESHPWALVTDLKMPDLDGLQLINEIRKISSKLSIVMISGHASRGHLVEAINKQIVAFLDKPFDQHELRNILIRIREDRALEQATNLILKSEKTLVEKLDELNQLYFDRMKKAEDRLFELEKSKGNQDDVLGRFEQVHRFMVERKLNLDIDSLKNEVLAASKKAKSAS